MVERLLASITFDLVMDEEMPFVEGCYQLPGKPWEIFIFSKKLDLEKININTNVVWSNGSTGTIVDLPEGEKLNKDFVIKVLSDILQVAAWSEVSGPDSIQVR